MTHFLAGYVVPAGAGLAGDPGLKASQHSTGGAVSVFEASIAVGLPLHVHDREDECFYVLDGELSVRCGGDAFDAVAGSFVILPRGRPHRFWAAGRPAQLLLIAVPGGIEDYSRQINAAATDDERVRIRDHYGIRVSLSDRAGSGAGHRQAVLARLHGDDQLPPAAAPRPDPCRPQNDQL